MVVGSDGLVTAPPAIKGMKVGGLSTQQLSDAIVNELQARHFSKQEANLQIVRNAGKFYVSGQVRRPRRLSTHRSQDRAGGH